VERRAAADWRRGWSEVGISGLKVPGYRLQGEVRRE
jgi:hypothetical protein